MRRFEILSARQVERVIEEALGVLSDVGVRIGDDGVARAMRDAGATPMADGRLGFPRPLCERALRTAPSEFTLFDRAGANPRMIGGEHTCFVPGSAAIRVYDAASNEFREPATDDVIDFVALTDTLDGFDLQSTGLVAADVAPVLADRYRLLLALAYGTKPVVTGTFTDDGFDAMLAMLEAVRGGRDALRAEPLAIFDCCPTSPLAWSGLAVRTLRSCAQSGVPAEIVPAPMMGATAPVTPAGGLVQLTAECVSGVVIHQTIAPGAPVVYGAAASGFDMRTGVSPMAAVEAMSVDVAHAQVGRRLELPVHAFLGLSDARSPDYQGGMETGTGAFLARLAGIHVAAGAGLSDYLGAQCLEKLVLDHEAARTASAFGLHVAADDSPVLDVIRGCLDDGFLTSDHTRQRFRNELHFPGDVIDRSGRDEWLAGGARDAAARARPIVEAGVKGRSRDRLEPKLLDELDAIARGGKDNELPEWRARLV